MGLHPRHDSKHERVGRDAPAFGVDLVAAGVLVLVDHARARQTSKRGGGAIRLNLDEEVGAADRHAEILEIDQCLTRLAALDGRQSRIVELRFFGGLSIEETAEVEGISPMTVKREWAVARAWLFREMKQRAE